MFAVVEITFFTSENFFSVLIDFMQKSSHYRFAICINNMSVLLLKGRMLPRNHIIAETLPVRKTVTLRQPLPKHYLCISRPPKYDLNIFSLKFDLYTSIYCIYIAFAEKYSHGPDL